MSTDTSAPLPAELSEKHKALKEHLAKLGAVAVAFSGGVDSTLLLSAAADALGDNAVAITARAQMIPARENPRSKRILHRTQHPPRGDGH